PSPDPQNPPAHLNPLGEPAVSVQDRVLMKRVREEWMMVELESCGTCHERWFDPDVEDGKCSKCRHKK
ncbi:hypothetical protein B0H13DRAFT_1611860, partial [Mycena leptocephala]